MDNTAWRAGPAHRPSFGHDHQPPQLPSFDNFLRGAASHDLALRGPSHSENAYPGHASPNKLSNSNDLNSSPGVGNLNGYRIVDQSFNHSQDNSSAIAEDHESPSVELHRRASLAFPMEIRTHPRPSRAYSSTTVSTPHREVISWQHGRVVQETVIQGKGPCYVYDDGSICPKEINGDMVNPKWGTTKAGKPRKRLGQACNTCREKKIKCDPGVPKCSQCLRFHRECRFETNSRQNHKSPKFRTSTDSPSATAAHSPKEYQPSRKSSAAPTEASTPTDVIQQTLSRSSYSVDDVLSPTMSDRHVSDAPTPSKRARLSESDKSTDQEHSEIPYRNVALDTARYMGFAPHVDPALVDPKLYRTYVEAFCNYVNVPTWEILPKELFTRWASTNDKKTLTDRLVLYAILALGTVHSDHRQRVEHRAVFKAVIYQELEFAETQYSLQLAHIFLYLSLAEYADAQELRGWSLYGRCVAVMSFLDMNVELPTDSDFTVYGFSPAVSGECRRRTYWFVFCADVYIALSKGSPRTLHSHGDIYLRLPCANELYEKGEVPTQPLFDQETFLPRNMMQEQYKSLASMAFLIYISWVCSQVHVLAWRSQSAFRVGQGIMHFRAEREKLEGQLKSWAEGYNRFIRATDGKTRDSDEPNHAQQLGGTRAKLFAGLDVLFHYTHMELNRRVYHPGMSTHDIAAHAKNATIHAIQTLKLGQQLLGKSLSATRDHHFLIRGPQMGNALHTAIDILTAAGKTTDIVRPESGITELMYAGLEHLSNIGTWWPGAMTQTAQVKERIQKVFAEVSRALDERKAFFYCSDPMVAVVCREFDLVYGTDRRAYLKAAYRTGNMIPDSDIYEINTKETKSRSQGG